MALGKTSHRRHARTCCACYGLNVLAGLPQERRDGRDNQREDALRAFAPAMVK